MLKEVIEKILSLAEVKTLDIDGRKYSTAGLVPVLEPGPTPIEVCTLTALADYWNNEIDHLSDDHDENRGYFIHVIDYKTVALRSFLMGHFEQRALFLLAKSDAHKFAFGQWMNVEQFIIGLQTQFVADKTTAELLKIVGNVSDGIVRQFSDDGVSQEVTAKTGVTRVSNVKVPSPVTLKPFRTFIEVDQPASPFIFRMKSGDEKPVCTLIEADAGKWKAEAMQNIKAWLGVHIEDNGLVILA